MNRFKCKESPRRADRRQALPSGAFAGAFALGLSLLGSSALAQTRLDVSADMALQGAEVELALRITDSPASAGFNAALLLPVALPDPDGEFPGADATISLLGVWPGELLETAGGFTMQSESTAEEARLLAYSAAGAFEGSGDLAYVQLAIGPNVAPGLYRVEIATSNPDLAVNSALALSDVSGGASLPVLGGGGELFVYSLSSDFDGDGLPDSWEMANGLDPRSGLGIDGGSGDLDGDGVSNQDEFLTGTDPTDAQSLPEGANGTLYVRFRDEFNDLQYQDRWSVELLDEGAAYSLVEDTLPDEELGTLTILDADLAQPTEPASCDALLLTTNAAFDGETGVLTTSLRPLGSGVTTLGLSRTDDPATRIELQLNRDAPPYVRVVSFEAGVAVQPPDLVLDTPLGEQISARVTKSGSVYGFVANGNVVGTTENLALGDSYQLFVGAESCEGDVEAVDTWFDRVELLLDRDGDGLADLHEDLDLDGEVGAEETNFADADSDDDDRFDGFDNCSLFANNAQTDGDADGFGDLCDGDYNGDCIVNYADAARIAQAFGTEDPFVDLNGNGFVDEVDGFLFRQLFFTKPGPSGLIAPCVQ
ncbi:MAG: hypothetical protein AAGA68_21170 [Pseudomonadota bacterium]